MNVKFSVFLIIILFAVNFPAASELQDIEDFSGVWKMVHQGNSGTLTIIQNGNKIHGHMITENGRKTTIIGNISDVGKWNIKRITFSRQNEPQVFTAYMFTHGSRAGLEMAGTFTYGAETVGGWYAQKLNQ